MGHRPYEQRLRVWTLRVLSRIGIDDGCWLWHGQLDHGGYGTVARPNRDGVGKRSGAHRVVYELLVGPIPDCLQLDHLCRNRRCVNPSHLEPVTASENLRRSQSAFVVCGRGHAMTPENIRHRKDGTRLCKLCDRLRRKKSYQNHRDKYVEYARRRRAAVQYPDCRGKVTFKRIDQVKA